MKHHPSLRIYRQLVIPRGRGSRGPTPVRIDKPSRVVKGRGSRDPGHP